jgi:fatty acid desaturase
MTAVVATRPLEPGMPRGSEFSELSRLIRSAGLLRRRPGYYTVKVGATALLFAAGWVAFAVLGESWWQLLTAVFLGIAFTQVAFLGHDAGHKQIFRTRRASYLLGLLHGNLAVGLSYGWWVDKHNRHHSHPNQIGHDPDIDPGPFVFTAADAAAQTGPMRLLIRIQAYLFLPMLFLEGMALHVASIRALVSGGLKARWVEGTLLVAHLTGYLTAVLLVLSPWQALAFVAIQQGVFGFYMGVAFAPNHKGMPVLEADTDLDFLRRQVLTSRNIHGGRVVDFALGGLNYQIEHHLFPSMPRPNLRHAQDLVRTFCQEHAVPYCETGLWRSYSQAIGHLNKIGAPPLSAG